MKKIDNIDLKLALITLTAILLAITVPVGFSEPWHEFQSDDGYGVPWTPPVTIIVEPWEPPVINLPEFPVFELITEFDYFLWTDHGGWWYDAEKTQDNDDDDLMCWAASCSNALEWTGWGIVTDTNNGLLEDTDEMFQNYNYYWLDSGGFMSRGWDWWFDGTDHSKLEIKSSGNYYATETYSTYYDEEWDQSLILSRIDQILHRGDCVTLGIRPVVGSGGHAITCWGFKYAI